MAILRVEGKGYDVNFTVDVTLRCKCSRINGESNEGSM